MRRIVVHLVRGEAHDAHIKITRDLADTFGNFPLHERIAPHLTLKRWFELDDATLNVLHEKLSVFAHTHAQTDYSLQGFGHFGNDVIYMDVLPSQEMTLTLKDLMATLHDVPGLIFDEYDTGGELHATVALGSLKQFNYDEIWNYLASTPAPNYKMKFDNIAIMCRTENKWEVEKVWEIGK